MAGKRLGFEDTRGTLFFEVARIAKVKQPKVILLENVKGLINHGKGKTLNTIIQTLCDIGYTVDFEVLNSKYFGVPQNRERVFIIAVRDDTIIPELWVNTEGNTVVPKGKRRIQQLEGVKTFNFDWPEQTKVTKRLRDILESNVDEKYYLSEEKTVKLVEQLNEKGEVHTESELQQFSDGKGISHAIDANYVKGTSPRDVGKGRRTHFIEAKEVLPVIGIDRLNKQQNGRRFKDGGEEMFTLTAQDRHGVASIQKPRGFNNGGIHEIAPAVTSNSYQENNVLQTQYRIRKLTPLECFRLQAFPDEYHEILSANGISNRQLYKMAGNAVTVTVVEAIGKRLLPYLTKTA